MPYDRRLNFVGLWIEGVYFIDQNWDRLRTIGMAKNLQDGIAELTFFPIRQHYPAQDERTNPDMKDPVMAEILESYNSVGDLCDFIIPTHRCNIEQEPSNVLGNKLKYMMRISNSSYPHLFSDIVRIPDHFSILDRTPRFNPYVGYIPVLDIHAYAEIILIAGGPIANASDWPQGYATKKVDYRKEGFNFRGIAGENIILPSSIDDQELGELVKSVWKAKKNTLPQN
jgi:hypothetical protein